MSIKAIGDKLQINVSGDTAYVIDSEIYKVLISVDLDEHMPCYVQGLAGNTRNIAFMPVKMTAEIIREFNNYWRCFDYAENPVQGFIYRDGDNYYFCYDKALDAKKARFVLYCLFSLYLKLGDKIQDGIHPELIIVEGAYRALMPYYDVGIEPLLKIFLYTEPDIAKQYKEGTFSVINNATCCPTWFLDKWLKEELLDGYEPVMYRTICENYITPEIVGKFAEVLQKAAHVVQGDTFVHSKVVVDCVSGEFVKTAEVFDNETEETEETEEVHLTEMNKEIAEIILANVKVTPEHVDYAKALITACCLNGKTYPDNFGKDYVGTKSVTDFAMHIYEEYGVRIDVVMVEGDITKMDFVVAVDNDNCYESARELLGLPPLYESEKEIDNDNAELLAFMSDDDECEDLPTDEEIEEALRDMENTIAEEEGIPCGEDADEGLECAEGIEQMPEINTADCCTLQGAERSGLASDLYGTPTFDMPFSVSGELSPQAQIGCIAKQLQMVLTSDCYKTYKGSLYARREDVLRQIYVEGRMEIGLQEELGRLCNKLNKLEVLESDALMEIFSEMTTEDGAANE